MITVNANLKDVIVGNGYSRGTHESDRAGISIPLGANHLIARLARDAWDPMNGGGVLESSGITDPFSKSDYLIGGNDLEPVRAFLFLSYDAGHTWIPSGCLGAAGGTHVLRNGQIATESTLNIWIPASDNPNRLARFVLDVRKNIRTKLDVDLLTLPDPGFVLADTHHSVAINGASAGASGTAAFTIGTGSLTPSGSNRLLFISGCNAGSSGRTVDFLWNGSAITADLWDVTAQSFFGSSAAYLLAPAASAASGTMTITGNVGQDDIGAGALACDGVDQVTPVGTPTTANGASGASSVTVSSAVGNAVIDTGYVFDTAITANQSQTARYSQTNINAETSFACGSKVGAASVTMGYAAAASGSYILGAVEIKAGAASPTITQSAFRARNDNGSESGATGYASENAGFTAVLDTNLRLRVQLDTTGDYASSVYRLDYKLSTDSTYVPVLTAAPSAPTFQAAGTMAGGTGAISPAWPTHQAGDIALLFVESTGGQPASLTTANGFAAVTNSPQATGATTSGTQLAVFWCRATSSAMSAPTVGDSGDHTIGQILTFRGCIAEGNPWNVTGGGVKAGASTSVSVTGVTTTQDNCLIVMAITSDADASTAFVSAQSNASLSSLTERTDEGNVSGNGGEISVTTGVLATAGASGTMTATVVSSINAFMTIALRPQTTPIMISASSNITAGGQATTAQLSAPSGKTTSDFTTGRMWDDENGTDAIDIASGQYTEVEWCIKALSAQGATNTQVYNFRVTVAGTALDTYSANPSWTLGSPPSVVRPWSNASWFMDNNYSTLPIPQQLLRFLGSDDSPSSSSYYKIHFLNPHLDGLPIWGPANAGVTYICERLTRVQHGYYGASPWWSNNGAFQWSGGSADSYYGICPYDISGNGTGNVHNWEISGISNGSDHQVNRAGSTVTVTHGVMRTQMLRVNYNSGNKFGLFYINCPSTANADVIQGPIAGSESNSAGAGNSNPPSPMVSYGDSSWTDFGKERFSGDLGRIKIFNTLLSEADGISEASDMSRLVTSNGIANIWYGKTNWRTIDDLTCDYGTGRSFVWADSAHKATLVLA